MLSLQAMLGPQLPQSPQNWLMIAKTLFLM
jgi:hypothetical protein